MHHLAIKRILKSAAIFSFLIAAFFAAGDAHAFITIQPASGPWTGAYPLYPDLQFYSPSPPISYSATYNYGCEQTGTDDLVCHKKYPTENTFDEYKCGNSSVSPSNLVNLGTAWLFNNCVFTGDSTAPSPFPVVTATPVSASQINVSWTPSFDSGSGMAFYRIFRFQGACCSPVPIVPNIDVPWTQTTYSHTGLSAGTSYGYYVLAYDVAGNPSGSGGTKYATTFSDGTAPSVPTGLTATAISPTQINLTWNPSTDNVGVAGYRIERCMGAGCASFVEITTSPVASFSDTGLLSSITYRYRVRAYDAATNLSGYSSIAEATTPAPPDTTPPTPAPVLSGSAISSTQIDLSWTPSSDPETGIASYRIYRGTLFPFFSMPLPIATVGGTTTTFSNSGLTPSVGYTYYVVAVNGQGLSVQSTSINISTPAPPDTTPPVFAFSSPAATLPAGTTFATLAGNTDETATCRYSTTSGLAFDSMTLFSTTGTTNHAQTITGLTDGTLYTYYVKCRDSVGNTNATDFSYMFQVDSPAPDTTPPVISNGAPTGVLVANTTSATMSVITNENAYCRYNQNSDIDFLLMLNALNSSNFQNHSVSLTGLTNGSSYLYYVRCQDTPAGNVNTSGYAISFSVAFPANVNPVALIVVSPATAGTAPFTISADGSGSYDTDGSIAQYIWNWGDGTPNTLGVPNASHTYTIAGTYILSLTVIDNQGGSGTANQTITVSVAAVPPPPPVSTSVCTAACTTNADCTPDICGPSGFCIAQGGGAGPTRFDGYLSRTDGSMSQPTPATFPAGTTSVIMSVKTDVNADCQYTTFINTPYGASAMKTFSTTGTTAHAVTLTGLSSVAAATHDYYVRCRDLATDSVNDTDYTISFITNAPNIVAGPNPYTCLINPNFISNNVPYLFDICIPK
ncbi:fibronectin type III domain-containing protein [Candidatus Azambacteria bacterium]|nr:fibronectin type III domain-containing protein [Candidatus Azambacteria bacterium]